LLRFICSRLITIIVGEGAKKEMLTVHRAIVTKKSGFFQSAFSGCWGNAEAKSINLSHLDPETFARYLEAVYIGHILPANMKDHEFHWDMALCNIYVIAEEMVGLYN
jgi:hypothetical protein